MNSHTEPQQSSLYAEFIQKLGWKVETIDGVNIFIRRFPLAGGMVKIHRPQKLPRINKLISVFRSNNIKRLVIEPDAFQNQKQLDLWCRTLSRHVTINMDPFLATKTVRIDVTRDEKNIFNAFSEAKRRAVRRAIKLKVSIRESSNIDDLIRIKNKSAGLFGFITTSGIKQLWQTFSPDHTAILLAYSSGKLVGGVLLIFWDGIAYYWIAGATHEGKKLFAPTLLVWETLKLAKRRGAQEFDLVGAWDERIPDKNTDWKGFTKFKEGFGGKMLYYPLIVKNI